MNKVFLVGNLTKDPELSTTTSGISVCKFSLAINRRFTNAAGEREVDFINIVVWRQQGENCAKFLKKGSKAAVVGSMQTRTYETQAGEKRYVTEVVADEVEFLSSKNESGSSYAPNAGDAGSNFAPSASGEKIVELEPIEDDSLPF